MYPALIGLHGRRGAGKDTAFGFIQEWANERGVHAARRGFADLLKLSFARLFHPDMNIQEAVRWCDQLKEQGFVDLRLRLDDGSMGETRRIMEEIHVSGRALLQRHGTEGHRDVFGENFWVDALLPSKEFEWTGVGQKVMPEAEKPRVSNYPTWAKSFVDGPFVQSIPEICCVTDVRFVNEAKRIIELNGRVWRIERDGATEDSHSSEVPLPNDLVMFAALNETGNPDALRSQVRAIMDREFSERFPAA